MAKRKSNKSALIRQCLQQYPGATAAEIVSKLAAQRVRVTPQLVYNIKSQSTKPKSKHNGKGSYADLFQAKKLVDAMGGIDKAKEALDVLARLTG